MYFLDSLRAELRSAAHALFGLNEEDVVWDKGKERADFATSCSFSLARQVKKKPLDVARLLRETLQKRCSPFVRVEEASPGFINFHLLPAGAQRILVEVLESGDAYGNCNRGGGRTVNLEFCSANPTGPIHVGNARGACIGFVLANLLQAVGYKVTQEYYFDDSGNQVDAFIQSIEAFYLQDLSRPCKFPENGYPGDYVRVISRAIIDQVGDAWADLPWEERLSRIREFGLQAMQRQHEQTMLNLGVEFDVWFWQSELKRRGFLDRAFALLEKGSYLYRKDGALWFRSTCFGDDKDRVVLRKNGEPTYFGFDIAYNLNKRERGFELIIDVWGPDHHGFVERNIAAFRALGYDPRDLKLLIYQMVHLYENGVELSMSKRSGEFVTLDELINAVGKDATIFYLLNRSTDSPLDFDLDQAREHSLKNPVYYVQYAFTRCLSVEKEAEKRGITISESCPMLCSLYSPRETKLLSLLALMPDEILKAALADSPFKLVNFAKDLAGEFHAYYHDVRVIGVEAELQAARLLLIRAVRTALGNTLRLMGIQAPEKM